MSPYPRSFVPAELDFADFNQIESLARSLLDRPIGSALDLDRWLLDVSELCSAIDEFGSRRYIEKSCHTGDAAIQQAFIQYIETIEPKFKPLFFRLQKRFLESPHRAYLSDQRHEILTQIWRADADSFREENVSLETEVARLINESDKLSAAMTVTIDGQEMTLQQASRLVEEPDRPRRRAAWEAIARRRLADREKMEEIFDQLLDKRHRIARNSGFPDYRAFQWNALKRFDYTPQQCLEFADAIAQVCVPLTRKLDRQRAKDLKLQRLSPWDSTVDPHHRPPLRPFVESDIDGFVEKTTQIMQRLSPDLARDFDLLRQHNHLDLASRKGKQPGGYQANLEEIREPFIFMNAAGTQRDVETLLHEAGHAFHLLAAREEPLKFLRSAPMEFCEVASMAMELFGSKHLDVFYGVQADFHRAVRDHFEGIIYRFPRIATIDSFQHWLYTHPGHSRQERTQEWLRLTERFGSDLDWTGHEQTLESLWQRVLHLFHAPFYFVEYGIAQLGALQLWQIAQHDPQQALDNYRRALALGGTRPLPELFAAAGIQFDFSAKTLDPLISALEEAHLRHSS